VRRTIKDIGHHRAMTPDLAGRLEASDLERVTEDGGSNTTHMADSTGVTPDRCLEHPAEARSRSSLDKGLLIDVGPEGRTERYDYTSDRGSVAWP